MVAKRAIVLHRVAYLIDLDYVCRCKPRSISLDRRESNTFR